MTEEPEGGRAMVGATLVMTALAALALDQGVLEPDRSRPAALASSVLLLIGPTVMAAWGLGRPGWERMTRGPAGVVALLGLFALPFLVEAGRLAAAGTAAMPEVVLMSALRNLTLGLAAMSARPAFARLAAVASLFLVTVASAIGEGPWVLALVASYATAGAFWLMLAYWRGLVASSNGPSSRFPAWAAAWTLAVVGAVAAAFAVGPSRATTVLGGLVPTSGGYDENDPDARGGVNDGDNEVAGSERPESVGFSDSEVYLETDRPSLYDAINDMYGEPFKPKEKKERMIAIGPAGVKEQQKPPAENLRAGREFPLVRRPPSARPRRPKDRSAQALVYVKGPTPLHMPLSAYDRFDGDTWREARNTEVGLPASLETGTSWMRLSPIASDLFGGAATHKIKVANLDASSLPVPPHLTRFRVGSVNQPDFFGWAQPGIVRMRERTLPAGTVVDAESRTIDADRLAAHPLACFNAWEATYLGEEGKVPPAVAALAREWTEGLPDGWARVAEVSRRLREGHAHDRRATAVGTAGEVGGPDAVTRFLLETKRGPDYLFASSAVLMLRSLGYRARLVSGLYAPPGRFDPRSRQTPVTAEDVHVWAEVQLGLGLYATVEPTPGYEVRHARESWGAWALRMSGSAADWGRRHAGLLGLMAVAATLLARGRREVADLLDRLAWGLAPGRLPRRRALRAFRLIERRAARAGRGRPSGATPARWYGTIAGEAGGDGRDSLELMVGLADWAAHAPEGSTIDDVEGVPAACARAVRLWPLRRFRDPGRATAGRSVRSASRVAMVAKAMAGKEATQPC